MGVNYREMRVAEQLAPIDVDLGISNLSLNYKTLLLGSVAAYGAHLDAISPSPEIPAMMEYTPVRSWFLRRLLGRGRDMEQRQFDAREGFGVEFSGIADPTSGLDRRHDWTDED